MRIAPVLLVAAGLLLVAPATASADVIFDPADADDLAAILAEAYTDQNVCYGWQVSVSDPIAGLSESVGSNFGAGKPVSSGSCQATVEFTADITYTSESSEAEDSSSYGVTSTPSGVTRAGLDDLGIDFGGLTGEDPDVAIGQAVTALPLLAADAGIANPIEAAPATGEAPADAQLTDNPGSDWWRNQGGMVMWAAIVMAAGGVFAWWVLRTDRRRRARRRPAYPQLATAPPAYQPPEPEELGRPDGDLKGEPPTEELPVQEPPAPEPPTEELPVQEPAVAEPFTSEKEPAEEAAEQPATEEKVAEAEPAAAKQAPEEQVPEEKAAEGQATEPSEASSTAESTESPDTPSPDRSTVDKPADPEPGSPEQARPAPSDQKDKE